MGLPTHNVVEVDSGQSEGLDGDEDSAVKEISA